MPSSRCKGQVGRAWYIRKTEARLVLWGPRGSLGRYQVLQDFGGHTRISY